MIERLLRKWQLQVDDSRSSLDLGVFNVHTKNTDMGGQAPRLGPEPLRSRWTPKPEQIMILESIFNSGMVNPPKHEAIGIRNMLQRFGPVGDTNVFYWFQNRRSRYRRLQRQIQVGERGGEQSHVSANSVSNGMNTGSSSYDSEVMTVFINGVATEMRRGCVNVWSMFGGDWTMYDSSGVAVEVNEYGYLVRSLQQGENYSLVPRNYS